MTISTAQKEALSFSTQYYFVSFTSYSMDWIQSAQNRDMMGFCEHVGKQCG